MIHDATAKVSALSGAADDEPPGLSQAAQAAQAARAARIPMGAHPQHVGVDTAISPTAIAECPLHMAMRRVAEVAVTQHVLYAEGVYRPREELARELQVWLRVHELMRTSMCPATRTGSAVEPGDLEVALAGLPEEMRATVAAAIRLCGRRTRGEGCPLEAEPEGTLIGQNGRRTRME